METLVLCLVLLLGVVRPAAPATFESDTTALRLFSQAVTGGNLQWRGDDPCGSGWAGVTCSSYNVTKLILNNVNLGGRLPLSIGNLGNLQTLDLSFNPQLGGPLPRTLGQLTNLEFLNLQSCGFTGDIPFELGGLKKLRFLALNINKLSGVIPPELGRLSSVYWFDLAQNQIKGPLPVSTGNSQNIGLDNLTAAVHFHLNSNQFTGSIPPKICFLPELKHLLVDNNDLSGEIPNEIGNFSKLTIMRLDKNQFAGSLPSTLGQIATLFEIHASDNAFTGTIPDLRGLKALQLISISNNSFGPQPVPSFAGLRKLQTIEINDANLVGPIPDGFFQLDSLEAVSMTHNAINGTVDMRSASASLVNVELDYNRITSLNTGSGGFTLSLSGNPVCDRGSLSDRVCASKLLTSWKANTSCPNTCSDQQTINPNTCVCGLPLDIWFRFNAPTFSSMTNDTVNKLATSLFDGLNLSRDQVWVERANFTTDRRLLIEVYIFPIRSEDRVNRQNASFIYNQLSTHQVDLDFFGPYSLFVGPLAEEEGARKHAIGTGVIVGIIVAVVITIIVVAIVGLYACKQKRRADKAVVSNPFASWGSRGGKDSGSAPQLKGARFFTVAEIKKATNNFSSSNEIGFGGYGKVYKGTLLTGEEVAIKRAQEGSLQGAGEFKNEIELLSRVHHRNLVGLIGFCYENGEQMLVYEYMPNGTIQEHLPDHLEKLTWRKRLEIAIGSAKGIAYLHELANPPIIHRDIKSSNILLDEKFVAKVADFGLSKLAPATDGKGHVSTQVKGTLGYLDPEYYMTQQLTEKSDVYSFGVVLLELITAKQPIEHGKYIVREVRAALDRGGLAQLLPMLDPYLRDYPREDLDKFVDIALSCVDETASNRPTMNEVVRQLEILLSHVSSSGFTRESSDNKHGLYSDTSKYASSEDPSFQYSGGFPATVQPK